MARRKMIDGTPATSKEADLEVANKELVPAGPPNSANAVSYTHLTLPTTPRV